MTILYNTGYADRHRNWKLEEEKGELSVALTNTLREDAEMDVGFNIRAQNDYGALKNILQEIIVTGDLSKFEYSDAYGRPAKIIPVNKFIYAFVNKLLSDTEERKTVAFTHTDFPKTVYFPVLEDLMLTREALQAVIDNKSDVIHELTHLYDYERNRTYHLVTPDQFDGIYKDKDKNQRGKERSRYYNHPLEFNAFTAEITNIIINDFKEDVLEDIDKNMIEGYKTTVIKALTDSHKGHENDFGFNRAFLSQLTEYRFKRLVKRIKNLIDYLYEEKKNANKENKENT
jgi:hypothetical protein